MRGVLPAAAAVGAARSMCEWRFMDDWVGTAIPAIALLVAAAAYIIGSF